MTKEICNYCFLKYFKEVNIVEIEDTEIVFNNSFLDKNFISVPFDDLSLYYLSGKSEKADCDKTDECIIKI